jgi:hypothetical protein
MNPIGTKSWTRLALAIAAVVACAASRARAEDWTVTFNPPPLHPSVIMVDYQGKSYPITAVAGEVPEIMVDGKLVHLRDSQTYQPKLATGFGHGSIQFRGQKASTLVRTQSYMLHGNNGMSEVPGGTVSTSGEYTCKLFSTEAHEGCFIAIVFFREDAQGLPDSRTIALAFGDIGSLAAGQEIPVKVNCAYVVPQGANFFCFPMVFSKGVEIRSDQSENAALFFHQQEKAAQAELLALYRKKFPTADRPVMAYLRYPPQLPDGVDPRSLPPKIDAKFAVVESGEVDSLEINQPLDPKVDQAIRRALGGWLFLPRLKNGVPVRTLIDVPLTFGSS